MIRRAKNIVVVWFCCFSMQSTEAYAQTCEIFGVVADSLTKQRLPSANVTILGTTRGASTNSVGYYVIPKLPPGSYDIIVSMVGYGRALRKITLSEGSSREIDFYLSSRAIEEQEVIVSGSRSQSRLERTLSAYIFERQELRGVPVALQGDLLQSLKIIPGITSTSDVSSRFYVRGGAGDQNLFLLNGARIYYPFHALGIYSIFNPSLVDNVEVYTGSFPAGFGGKLSSVVNITTRDGRSDRISGEASINLLSTELNAEGPASSDGSWLVNVRKSMSSRSLSRVAGQELPVSFYDATAKGTLRVGGLLKYDLTFLTSGDDLLSSSVTQPSYRWRNNAASLTGYFLPTSRVFVQWLLYASFYSASRDAKLSPTLTTQSTSVDHYGLRCTGTVYTGAKDQYDFGFEFSVPSLSFDFTNRMRVGAAVQSTFVDISAWARYQVQLGRTHLEGGLHAELAPLFEGSPAARELQPRINLSHDLNGGWSAKASYGRFTQRVMTIGNEDEIVSIFEGWVKVPSYLPAQTADHFVIGLSGNPMPSISLKAEAYLKSYGTLAVYNWEKTNIGDPDYVEGKADSYGFELVARSKYSWVDIYGAYSLSWAWIKNLGITYNPRYDRRHHLNLLLLCRPARGMNVSLRWEFGSGFPFSQSTGYVEHPSVENSLPGRVENAEFSYMMLFGAKNVARLPSYHRLDASISYNESFFGLNVRAGIDLLNIYNKKNIFYFDRFTGERVYMISFFPSLSLAVMY